MKTLYGSRWEALDHTWGTLYEISKAKYAQYQRSNAFWHPIRTRRLSRELDAIYSVMDDVWAEMKALEKGEDSELVKVKQRAQECVDSPHTTPQEKQVALYILGKLVAIRV